MQIYSAVIQDFEGAGRELGMENGPFHDVNVVGSFGRHNVGVSEVDLHLGTVEGCTKRGEPWSFKMWKGGSDVKKKGV